MDDIELVVIEDDSDDLEEGEIFDDDIEILSISIPLQKKRKLPRRYELTGNGHSSTKRKKDCKHSVHNHKRNGKVKDSVNLNSKVKQHKTSCPHRDAGKHSGAVRNSCSPDLSFRDYNHKSLPENPKGAFKNYASPPRAAVKTKKVSPNNSKLVEDDSYSKLLLDYKASQVTLKRNSSEKDYHPRKVSVDDKPEPEVFKKEIYVISSKPSSENVPPKEKQADAESEDEDELRKIALASCIKRLKVDQKPFESINETTSGDQENSSNTANVPQNDPCPSEVLDWTESDNRASDNYEIVDMELDSEDSVVEDDLFVIDKNPSMLPKLAQIDFDLPGSQFQSNADFEEEVLRAQVIANMFTHPKNSRVQSDSTSWLQVNPQVFISPPLQSNFQKVPSSLPHLNGEKVLTILPNSTVQKPSSSLHKSNIQSMSSSLPRHIKKVSPIPPNSTIQKFLGLHKKPVLKSPFRNNIQKSPMGFLGKKRINNMFAYSKKTVYNSTHLAGKKAYSLRPNYSNLKTNVKVAQPPRVVSGSETPSFVINSETPGFIINSETQSFNINSETPSFIININQDDSTEESSDDESSKKSEVVTVDPDIDAFISNARQKSDFDRVNVVNKNNKERYSFKRSAATDPMPPPPLPVKEKSSVNNSAKIEYLSKKISHAKENLAKEKDAVNNTEKELSEKKTSYMASKLKAQHLKEQLHAAEIVRGSNLELWKKCTAKLDIVKQSVSKQETLINLLETELKSYDVHIDQNLSSPLTFGENSVATEPII